jgi:C-terminal processing protease CtpA/Prc
VTPKGRRLESDGVEPDVKVVRTVADVRAGRDADLEAALRELQARR